MLLEIEISEPKTYDLVLIAVFGCFLRFDFLAYLFLLCVSVCFRVLMFVSVSAPYFWMGGCLCFRVCLADTCDLWCVFFFRSVARAGSACPGPV